MRLFVVLLLAAGCAAAASPRESRRANAFERELARRVAGEPKACVSAMPGQGLTVAGSRAVTLRSGGTIWVNRPSEGCARLDDYGTLIVEAHGSQYCRGDRVRLLPAGSTIPGPYCILGDFTPYRRPR